jgi:hypothetical protein
MKKYNKEKKKRQGGRLTVGWTKLAEEINKKHGGRKTGAQTSQHWTRVMCPSLARGPWTEEEEKLLFEAIRKHGISSWATISRVVGTRSDGNCKYHYTTLRAADVVVRHPSLSSLSCG